ncbi:MAG: FAD-dependent oxidoreductase [Candidatus Auribacter fodinae]|uniref:FAD-dependent oxidoreductase n=1 Tax=Candidatus Auribacter fodinae TaxID=2093366 RepID=A0A3A4R485_9BACT|nr:MAG: FAD-dependent oxidoreductase [Candidatus Auribacter fodinae]
MKISRRIFVYTAQLSAVSPPAISAAIEGKSSVIVEYSNHFGGMTTGGLSAMDVGSNLSNHGGIFREFTMRINQYYYDTYGEGSLQYYLIGSGVVCEPKVAEQILTAWVQEYPSLITLMKNQKITAAGTSASGSKTKIDSITIEDKNTAAVNTITASFFIDASYEQDLGHLAGVGYTVGREGSSEHNEWLAGQVKTFLGRGPITWLTTGAADSKIMAYNYRLTIDKTGNGVPFPAPATYDPAEFATLDAWMASDSSKHSVWKIFSYVDLPNGKRDANCSVFARQGSDWATHSWDYPEATQAERDAIAEAHKEYILRLIHHLKNGTNIPQAIKDEMPYFELPSDEFTLTSNFPPQLYVREGRRMADPAYLMTQQDVHEVGHKLKDDVICLGTYMMDSHLCDVWGSNVTNEYAEGLFINPNLQRAYQVPYRCLYPVTHTNFFSAFGVGATHVAFSSLRMEPQFFHFGQAAAVASSIALDNSITDVSLVPYSSIRTKLESVAQFMQVLEPQDPYASTNWNPAVDEAVTFTNGIRRSANIVKWDFDGNGITDAENEEAVTIKFPSNKKYRVYIRDVSATHCFGFLVPVGDKSTVEEELLQDNTEATPVGVWYDYKTHVPFVGMGTKYDGNGGKGIRYFEYDFTVPESGYYDVCFSLPQDSSLSYANNVPIEIVSSGYTTFNTVFNQTLTSYSTRPFFFVNLGKYFFLAGQTHYIRLKNDGTTANVIADACKLVRSGTWNKGGDSVYSFADFTQTADTDSDGMLDGWEISFNLNPIANDAGADSDNDGITNMEEYSLNTNPSNADSDNDTMLDGWEMLYGLNPLFDADAQGDLDNDGVVNSIEHTRGMKPDNTDSDNDTMLDGWEVQNNLDPINNDSISDADNDGVVNSVEYFHNTNPHNADTDGDGYTDLEEITGGTDPNNPADPFNPDAVLRVTTFAQFTEAQGVSVIFMGWRSQPGKTYTLYVQTNMIGPDFVILEDNLISRGTHTYYVDQGGGPNNVPHPSEETGPRLYKIVEKIN